MKNSYKKLEELMDIDYDNISYYSQKTRDLYENIMKNELYKEEYINIHINTLFDLIKYSVVLEDRIDELNDNIDELNEEIDRGDNDV